MSWAWRGQLLVTHKRITVILLTLALELLLKDGNRSRGLIKNAPDFSRRPRLMTVPKVPWSRNAMGSVKQTQLNISSRVQQRFPNNLPSPEMPVPTKWGIQGGEASGKA